MWKKPRRLKKPPVYPFDGDQAVSSIPFFTAYFFAFKSARNFNLSTFSIFTFAQTSATGSAYNESEWYKRPEIVPHLNQLIRIQSHTWNRLQLFVCDLNQVSPSYSFCPSSPLPKAKKFITMLLEIALPERHLKTIGMTARKDVILLNVAH